MASHAAAAPAAEKRQQAFELRKAGASYRSIGGALQVSHTQARRYVEQVLDDLRKQTVASAERYRVLQLERLNDMMFALWPAVKRGDTTAIREARGCMEREAKLLGIDAPERIDHFLRQEAERIAADTGLDPEEILADVDRLYTRQR